MISKNLFLLPFFFFINSGYSEISVFVYGKYSFGSNISRDEGCKRAEKVAMLRATNKSSSQFLISDKELKCFEQDGNQNDCSYSHVLSIHSLQTILSFIKKDQEIKDFGHYQVCSVYGVALIDDSKYDPNFFFTAILNKHQYKDGDSLQFKIETNSDICMTVFHVTEREKSTDINMIYPNKNTKEKENCIKKGVGFLPSTKMQESWSFRVSDEGLSDIEKEYFLIFGTKNPIYWLSEYRELRILWKQFLEINSFDRYFLTIPLIIDEGKEYS